MSHKKFRDKYNVFVAEGEKLVKELLPFFKVDVLFVVSDAPQTINMSELDGAIEITSAEMKRISNLTSVRNVLAVFFMPNKQLDVGEVNKSLTIALDGIQDPGNLGTILRIADWFGIKHVVCSQDTVDVYNPKVIQATMGALARVSVHYVQLDDFFQQIDVPVYGTFLEGENIYTSSLAANGVIVMGNEGNGITKELSSFVTQKLLIPPYPPNAENVESLNVGVATAIICAEFRRKGAL